MMSCKRAVNNHFKNPFKYWFGENEKVSFSIPVREVLVNLKNQVEISVIW